MNWRFIAVFYGTLGISIACTFALGWLGLCLALLVCSFSLVVHFAAPLGATNVDSSSTKQLEDRLKTLEERVSSEITRRVLEARR